MISSRPLARRLLSRQSPRARSSRLDVSRTRGQRARMVGPDELVLCGGTLLAATLRQKLEAAVAGGFGAITLWPHDYQREREAGASDAELRRLLADHGVEVDSLDPLRTWLPEERELAARSIAGAASEDDFYRIADALGPRSLNAAQGFGRSIDLDRAADALAKV